MIPKWGAVLMIGMWWTLAVTSTAYNFPLSVALMLMSTILTYVVLDRFEQKKWDDKEPSDDMYEN